MGFLPIVSSLLLLLSKNRNCIALVWQNRVMNFDSEVKKIAIQFKLSGPCQRGPFEHQLGPFGARLCEPICAPTKPVEAPTCTFQLQLDLFKS